MNMHFKPRRATCIVECEQGIILAETEHGMILLPGGQATRGESRLATAIRELKDETNLSAHAAIYLFDHESRSNRHKVFYLVATGIPEPHDDAIALHYYEKLTTEQRKKLSPATAAIVEQFLQLKQEQEPHLNALKAICLKDKVLL